MIIRIMEAQQKLGRAVRTEDLGLVRRLLCAGADIESDNVSLNLCFWTTPILFYLLHILKNLVINHGLYNDLASSVVLIIIMFCTNAGCTRIGSKSSGSSRWLERHRISPGARDQCAREGDFGTVHHVNEQQLSSSAIVHVYDLCVWIVRVVWGPLHYACWKGHLRAAILLVDFEANIDKALIDVTFDCHFVLFYVPSKLTVIEINYCILTSSISHNWPNTVCLFCYKLSARNHLINTK